MQNPFLKGLLVAVKIPQCCLGYGKCCFPSKSVLYEFTPFKVLSHRLTTENCFLFTAVVKSRNICQWSIDCHEFLISVKQTSFSMKGFLQQESHIL
jgi:hypothetical protein